MERSNLALVIGLCSSIVVSGVVRPAAGCSICLAGDPIYTSQGATAQQVGDVGVALQVRGWSKRSGVLPGEGGSDDADAGEGDSGDPVERNLSRRLDLFLSWSPIDRLTLSVDLPFAFNRITEREDGQQSTSSLSGLGDVALLASVVLWRDREVLPSTWIEGRGFLKAPSGASKQRVHGVHDPHLQTGTGSWDYGLGLAGGHRLEWGSLYASATYRFNSEGSLDYEYGDVVLATTALDVSLGHVTGFSFLDPLTPGLGFDYRWAAKDRFQGERYSDSGGSILYVTPSLRIRLPWLWPAHPPSLQTSVQIPTTTRFLRGEQDEKPTWQAGLQVTF